MSRRTALLLLGGVGLCWVVAARAFWFVVDDAWITFRYAQNLATGYGLRFNPADDPVEGYSNTMWMLAAAVCEVAGVDPGTAMPVVSIGCGLVLIGALYRAATGPMGLSRLAGVAAAALFVSSPPALVWATGGLETMAFALAVFVLLERLALRAAPEGIGAGVAAVAVVLLRPEGPAWVVLVGGIGLIVHRGSPHRGAWMRFAALAGGGLLALLLFRLAVFGDLVPNTVHAKSVSGPAYWWRGFGYVATWALTTVTPLLLPITSLVVLRRRDVWPVVAVAWAFPLVAIAVGGDFLPMARFLVPSLALHALLVVLALQELRAPALRGMAVAAVAAVGLLPAFDVHLVPEDVRAAFHYRRDDRGFESELARWRTQRTISVRQRELGLALRAWCDREGLADATVVAGAIGAMGYASGLHIFDQNGLVDAAVRLREAGSGARMEPGHDRKVSPLFFLPRAPTVLFVRMVRSRRPGDASRQLSRWAERVRGQLGDVPDYAPAVGRTDHPGQFLFVLRRTDDAAAGWRRFEAEVAALASGDPP